MTAFAAVRLDDRGNRAFWLLVGLVLAFRTALMLLACCAICMAVHNVLASGPAAVWGHRGLLLPAFVLGALVGAAVLVALVRAAREVNADRRLRREARARAVPVDVRTDRVAARFGLAGRVRVVRADESFAFTYGLVRPSVLLSTVLVSTLDSGALAAVLAHESAHVASRDPLKVLVARVLLARVFYLPALRHVAAAFVAGRELAADRHAVVRCGTHALAGALLGVLAPPAWAATTPAAAMASAAGLDARVSQLENGKEPAPPPAPAGLVLLTGIVATLVLSVAAYAGIVVSALCVHGR